MQIHKKVLIIAGSVLLVAGVLITTIILSRDSHTTRINKGDFSRNDLSNLTYSINGTPVPLTAGAYNSFKLVELSGTGDINHDGIRDIVTVIKDSAATSTPYFLTAALSTNEGLVTIPALQLSNSMVPHSLLIQDSGTIVLEYLNSNLSKKTKNILTEEYMLSSAGTLDKKSSDNP